MQDRCSTCHCNFCPWVAVAPLPQVLARAQSMVGDRASADSRFYTTRSTMVASFIAAPKTKTAKKSKKASPRIL